MKKVVFITALVCVILVIAITGSWLFASAAPYEETVNEAMENNIRALSSNVSEATVEHNTEAIILAQVVYGEASGIWSVTEQACVMWTILNRLDTGEYGDSIEEIACYGAYYYYSWFHTTDGYGRDLIWLAEDVLARWRLEKLGGTDIGRVLPADYLWFYGDGKHNHFRNAYEAPYDIWDYSLPSPYES